ncbi:MAG: hypothetical protein K5829_06230 [Treponema sp.]|nr:hypothetical protein [Treponema sp.]
MKKYFFSFCFILFSTFLFAQKAQLPDPYSSKAVKAFADSLFSDGFFEEAEAEYKRFIFLNKDSAFDFLQDSIFSLTAIYNQENNKAGSEWLYNNFYGRNEGQMDEKILKLYSRLLFLERNPDDFSNLFNLTKTKIKTFSTELQFILPFSDFLLKKDIKAAEKICIDFNNSILSDNFKNISNLCKTYKPKSPGLALFFSALLPGSGKIYTGSLQGGISSFFYVGGFAAGSIYSAINFGWKDWRPYTFGTAALCFYAAELYGAYKSAKRYNQALYLEICKETDSLYEEIF